MARFCLRSLVGIALAVVLGSSASAVTIDASSRGWYSQAGQHTATNRNTMTGKLTANSGLRSFFVFDLGEVSQFIGSGVLRLELEGYFGPDATEFVAVYDVGTDVAELVLSQSGRTDIYDDLGGDVTYGAILAQLSDVGTVLEIPLTPEAIDAINLAAGGRFAVGISVETLGTTDTTEGVRFSRGNDARVHQLVLTEAPPSMSVDPSLAAMAPPSDHAVTAHVFDGAGAPMLGAMVAFMVESGPNAGIEDSVATDADGEATFSYPGDAVGVDRIQVSLPDAGANAPTSEATAFWDDDCNGNAIPDSCDLSCGGFDGECAAFAQCGGSLDEDASGFPDECEVVENAPPVCGDASASPAMLRRSDRRFREVAVLGVTDPDGDPVEVVVDAVYQDEPVTKRRHRRSSPDARGVGESDRVELRAESSDRGNGRVYHVSFAADDGIGGSCSGTVLVCVPRPGKRHGASCVDEGPLFDSTEGASHRHGGWCRRHHHRHHHRHGRHP